MGLVAVGWRFFRADQLRDALFWAGKGGVSLLEIESNHFATAAARLLACDIEALDAAACSLHLDPHEIQMHPGVPPLSHFLLSGDALQIALAKCARDRKPVRWRTAESLVHYSACGQALNEALAGVASASGTGQRHPGGKD